MKTRFFVAATLLAMAVPAFSAPVSFSFVYTDATGTGFNDAVLGADRRAALEQAGATWSNLLNASYVGETIVINANFSNISTSGSPLSATSALATVSNIQMDNKGLQNVAYTTPLAEYLAGRNLNGTSADYGLTFSSTVSMTAATYLGRDGNTPADQFDFTSYAVRGIGRVLGINSRLDRALVTGDGSNQGGFLQQWDASTNSYKNMPTLYDTMMVAKQGDGTFASLLSMSDAQRVAAVTSGELYWIGGNAKAANGGQYVKLNSLPLNADGTINGNATVYLDPSEQNVMAFNYPGLGKAAGVDSVTIGMMADLGWSVNAAPVPEASTYAMLLAGLGMLGVVARRRLR